MPVRYVTGDLFAHLKPPAGGAVVIPHVCNDVGAWGAGFTRALDRHYPKARQAYGAWWDGDTHPSFLTAVYYPCGKEFDLGRIQIAVVAPGVHVANMIAQIAPGSDTRCLRYDALAPCLAGLARHVKYRSSVGPVAVAAPEFGAGLAGGDWHVIEALVEDYLCRRGYDVTVYRLPAF